MLESYLKPTYQKYCIQRVLQIGVINRISPNTITLFSLLTGISIFPALYFQQTMLALMICLPEYFTIFAVAFSVLVLFTGLMRMKEFALNQE